MSRVAKNPVKLPQGVEVKVEGQEVSVKGPKGALNLTMHPSVELIQEEGELRFAPRPGSPNAAMAGTTRALVNNMVVGVSQGFERKLQLVGVGIVQPPRVRLCPWHWAFPTRSNINCLRAFPWKPPARLISSSKVSTSN